MSEQTAIDEHIKWIQRAMEAKHREINEAQKQLETLHDSLQSAEETQLRYRKMQQQAARQRGEEAAP